VCQANKITNLNIDVLKEDIHFMQPNEQYNKDPKNSALWVANIKTNEQINKQS